MSLPHVVTAATTKQSLDQYGALQVSAVLSVAECAKIQSSIRLTTSNEKNRSAGQRNLLQQSWCQTLATHLLTHPQLQPLLPADAIAIQCNYFEKTTDNNWALAMHQDTMIPVAARVSHPALRGWSIKQGQHFVQAPGVVLAQMVALRLHLDGCNATNGALRIVAGSHRRGILSAAEIARDNDVKNTITCTAHVGDVWAMRPLALHASSRVVVDGGGANSLSLTATSQSTKRWVLHLVFAPTDLPYGLSWPKLCSAGTPNNA